MPGTFQTLAVSPSGATLLNVLQVTTSAGTVLSEIVYQPAAATLGYGQVTVLSTSATTIVSARPTRTSLTVEIAGTASANVYLGDASVLSTTGMLLLGIQGASILIPTSGAVVGVTDGSSNQVVSYLETYL